MLLTGFVGWVMPVPDTGRTMVYLSHMCKTGTAGPVMQDIGLSCSEAGDITYLIYGLLAGGIIVTLAGIFWKKRQSVKA